MKKRSSKKEGNSQYRMMILAGSIVIFTFLSILIILTMDAPEESQPQEGLVRDPERIENGIHLRTGLKVGEGMEAVIRHCTPCHSASLVTQNRMDAAGWESTIHWMQETQNLWDLGEDHELVVRYLTRQYPVKSKGRRQALKNIEWYSLDGQNP